MDKPRVEIKYVDTTDTDGYLRIIVNGFIQPSIRTDFDTGNESTIHMGLSKVLEHLYEMAYRDGERAAKQKVCDLLEWVKSR